MKHFLRRLFVQAALLAVLASPLSSAETTQEEDQQEAGIYGNLETFANILDLVQKHYVDEVVSGELLAGAVKGMIAVLDPHSSYLTPKEYKELQDDAAGSFIGIGIEVAVKEGMLTVVEPMAGSPAFKEGIKAGDHILSINGQPTKDMGVEVAVALLRGGSGEKVTLSVSRPGQEGLREVVLVRKLIHQQSVLAAELAPGLHHVRISNFQADTARDFSEALKQAGKKQPVNGLILDLRDNPGGLVDQAVKVADLFLDQGLIVSTKGRSKEDNLLFEAHPDAEKQVFPIILVVNGGTASAAEIVAGALQDHKRALVLGVRTFGKGSVQTVRALADWVDVGRGSVQTLLPLPDGGALRLTTARYYTPSGRSIQETGIIPDMIVPLAKAEEERVREKDLRHHLENKNTGSEEREAAARLAADNQLLAALFLLQNLR